MSMHEIRILTIAIALQRMGQAGGQPVEGSVLRRVLEGQDEVGVRGGRVGGEKRRARRCRGEQEKGQRPLQAPVLRGR